MNRIFARWGWVSLGGALLLGAGVARGDWPHPPENIQEHVVGLKEETPAVKAVREHLAAALAGVKPVAEAVPQVSATADKGYLLWGDLFKAGSCFALYETKEKAAEGAATLALAEWKDGKWELRGLWKMPVTWVPQEERWGGTVGGSDPGEVARVPFNLEDLGADGVPEVIVAGERPKYRQVMYLMHFNKENHGLDLLTYSMEKPVKAGKYVRLYAASGNKATWQEWTFLEWEDGKLMERAAWRPVMPYRAKAAPFTLADVTSNSGKRERYRIEQADGGGENTRIYAVSESGQQMGTVTMEWKPEKISRFDSKGSEQAWFFEKLTGLPREYFPNTLNYTSYKDGKQEEHRDEMPERLENDATPRGEGGPQIYKLFAPTK